MSERAVPFHCPYCGEELELFVEVRVQDHASVAAGVVTVSRYVRAMGQRW